MAIRFKECNESVYVDLTEEEVNRCQSQVVMLLCNVEQMEQELATITSEKKLEIKNEKAMLNQYKVNATTRKGFVTCRFKRYYDIERRQTWDDIRGKRCNERMLSDKEIEMLIAESTGSLFDENDENITAIKAKKARK